MARAQAVPLRELKLVVKTASDIGALGKFFEPMPGRNSNPAIGLKPGREDLDMWVTLAHELGHYWSWATGRRPDEFLIIEEKYAARMVKLGDYIRREAGSRDRMDPHVYLPLRAAAEQAFPQDLAEEERRAILDEERRAWCFAAALAQASGVDAGMMCQSAQNALGHYFDSLDLATEPWVPGTCPPLNAEGSAFVQGLAS